MTLQQLEEFFRQRIDDAKAKGFTIQKLYFWDEGKKECCPIGAALIEKEGSRGCRIQTLAKELDVDEALLNEVHDGILSEPHDGFQESPAPEYRALGITLAEAYGLTHAPLP